MPRILLVEDDPALREMTWLSLVRRGHEVAAFDTGEAGLAAVARFRPDLVLLDVGLPGLDGIELCDRLRRSGPVPVIMVSGRGEESDVIGGLDAGADDYLVKPASVEVVEARIRAVLRRAGRTAAAPQPEVHGRLVIDRAGLTVRKEGRLLSLTPSALRLLLHLTAFPGQVFSRSQLLEHMGNRDLDTDTRMVDACVRRLRHAVEDEGGRPRYVQTVRGFGYRFGPL
ncbi:response regulator transcription factor [Streptomyces erythrochromogenes]|uniref:response regulator transcription factor n=1 Tax=Streptomyces erythrochromogenes TaxID=285574 RepID=UPI003415DE96